MAQKKIVRIGAYKDIIASGVQAGDVITLSGQVGVDEAGQIVGPGDLVAQTRQAYTNVRSVLAEFGAPADSVIDEIWFVRDMADTMAKAGEMDAVRKEVLGPSIVDVSHTLIGVAALAEPGYLIEVKCIARL